ncbi:MAG: ATP-binding protein [Spirochaetia bacterium]|nr:ATP-binding protein [Spirochaetia bacterium]
MNFSEFRQIAESANMMIISKKKLHDLMLKNHLDTSVMRLAGGFAHEFNNQLMGISGYAELLPGERDRKKREEYQKRIILGVEKSRELVDSLLSYARRDTKKSERVDIGELVKKCVKMVDLNFSKSIKTGIEIASSRAIVIGDREELLKMLMNVCLNAVDALPDGGEIFIRTSDRINRDGNMHILVSVSDNGEGIDPTIRETVFEPFFSTRDKSYNSGMGLAASAGIAGSHGGSIWFEPAKGSGTVFYISLPAADQEIKEQQ